MADSQYVVEQLWAKISARLAETAAPEGGWPINSLTSSIQGTLANASTAFSAVSSAVTTISTANAGKLIRVGAGGNIVVPPPTADTDPSPKLWVEERIIQAITEYSQQTSSPVTSVNGKTGAVTLTATDVGARPAATPLAISATTGLQAALDAKATATALTNLTNGIPGQIDTKVNAALGPVNTSISSVSGRVGTLESQFAGIQGKPAGGWSDTDLDESVNYLLTRVSNATPNATSETIVYRNTAGTFNVGTPTGNAHPATKKYVDDILATKADAASLTSISNQLNAKADTSTVTTVSDNLTALTTRVTSAETALTKKVELETGGTFSESYIPALPVDRITGLQAALDSKPTLTSGKLALSTIPTGIPQASVSGLAASFAAKADLVGGKIPTSQIPAIATHETYPVTSKAAMLALTTAQVQIGDVAIITTAGSDQGTYTLTAANPAVDTSWTRHQAPQDTVLSVNGKQGTVVLSAADVSARALGSAIIQDDVTGLTTALNARPTKTYVDTELAKKTAPSDVTAIISGLSENKMPVDLVATANQLTLSGLKSVDGVLMQAGQRVLLTAQQASAANGIYVVGAGEWTRATDMPNGSTLLPGTSVIVKSGTDYAQSIWQLATTSATVVGTGVQSWVEGYSGKDPISYSAGSGLQVSGTQFSVKLGASSGLISDSAGLRLDPSSAVRKVVLTVPSGSTVATLTHNLGTSDITAAFIDNASQEAVLVPWTVVNANTISCEFAVAVTANAYRCVLVG